MARWLRWHCPPDTRFEIRALAVWGRARYFSVTEAPHNTDFSTKQSYVLELYVLAPKVPQHHCISMPYGPHHTNKFAVPYVCLYHVYVLVVHTHFVASELKDPIWHSSEWQIGSFSSEPTTCSNELFNIYADTHARIKVNVHSEHEPYQSNGDTFDTSPLRIIRVRLRTIPNHPYKHTVRIPEQFVRFVWIWRM